ncbi:MAG: efflux RND transporter periplasmic adaptor subunit [Afipia sp.]|nr:efflux RND transporter periplasmic adaptor subunit [Afipia sp.]OJW61630.1 MAG: efflux transporter periplasmic adaptor subunit [Afipia sp. 64-13]
MPSEQPKHVSVRKLRLAGLIAGVVIVLVVVFGIVARENSDAKLRAWTDAQAVPSVAVGKPNTKPVGATITLPGRIEAYSRAPIYARVSGYLKSWNVDIGAKVKSGDLLAEIEAPDLDQQLLQARADLANAQAAAKLSAATLKRRQTLLSSNFVSQQEIDERSADLASKEAQVKAMQANVDRLQALTGYKRVEAPFDGIVIERNTDVGALISGGGGSGPAMFVIADMQKLRVYVSVPQSYLAAIRTGSEANISVPEYPGRRFVATVESSAQAVDISTGTTRMQLALDNSGGELRPGAFANVQLKLSGDAAPLSIPAGALVFNKSGLSVATVDDNDRIRFKTVTIARDLGREIEIATGLSPHDTIVVTPLDGIVDGDQVRVAGRESKGSAEKKTSDAER